MNNTIYDFPNLRKIIEEMGFDQGAPRSFYFRSFQYALNGKGANQTVYDANRLEALAKFSVQKTLGDVITLEEARKAEPADYVNEVYMNSPFYDQLAGGCAEINDVIRTKGDWDYLLKFLDDVFNTIVPEGEIPTAIKLYAERETEQPRYMGEFNTLAAAAKWIDDNEGSWPEGFDAIAEMPDGAMMYYADKWEPFD